LGTEYFVHHKIALAIKKVDFASDTMSYIVLRGGWFNIIVLNVHVTSKEKSDDLKAVFMGNSGWFSVICLRTKRKFR